MDEINSYIDNIDNKNKQADAKQLLALLTEESGYSPVLNGSIIGFGQYHYKYDSGREGDSFVIGFSPRKANLVVYIMPGFAKYQTLLAQLGKHKQGKSCLYINKLKDVDLNILRKIANLSIKEMQAKYQC